MRAADLELPSPELLGGGASVLVILRPGLAPFVVAGEGELRLPLALGDEADVYVVGYACSLEALELERGRLPVVAPTSVGARRLPEAERVLHAVIRDGVPGPFTGAELGELDDVVIAGDPSRVGPCFEATVSTIVVATATDSVTLLLPLEDGDGLVATKNGRFFRVAPGQSEPIRDLPPSTPHIGGFRAPDGELWLVGEGGVTVHGDLARGFVSGPRMVLDPSCPDPYFHASVSPPGAPFEVFTLSCNLDLERFDGTTWSVIEEDVVEIVDETPNGSHRLGWVGPNDVLFTPPDVGPNVLRFRNGARSLVQTPYDALDAARSAVHLPGHGTLVGSDLGYVHLFNPAGSWTPITVGTLPTRGARIITATPSVLGDGGFMFGGENGIWYRYVAGAPQCLPLANATGSALHAATTDRRVIVHETRDGLENITFFDFDVKLLPTRCPLPL